MTDRMKKAPAATGAIKNRSTNHYEGDPMTTIVPEATVIGQTDEFATIHVAGATVAPDTIGGNHVVLEFDGAGERLIGLTEACALAAALQAVAVHLMEQQPREIRRSTAPGAPEFEEAI